MLVMLVASVPYDGREQRDSFLIHESQEQGHGVGTMGICSSAPCVYHLEPPACGMVLLTFRVGFPKSYLILKNLSTRVLLSSGHFRSNQVDSQD